MTMRLVVVESRYAPSDGRTLEQNTTYARKAMADSLQRGEAPYLSHLLYTQVLDDTIASQRRKGVEAGFEWGRQATLRAIYIDHGMSRGMVAGLEEAVRLRQPIVFRSLEGREGQVAVKMEGGPYRVPVDTEWTPPDPIETLRDLLAMVSHNVPLDTIRAWTRRQRDLASDWAAAVHLVASDNEDVTIPPKPDHLRGYDQADLCHGIDTKELQVIPGTQPLPDPTNSPGHTDLMGPVHLLAMGGLETVCGIRRQGPDMKTTYERAETTCFGCLHRLKG